jgi:hypothetical protein
MATESKDLGRSGIYSRGTRAIKRVVLYGQGPSSSRQSFNFRGAVLRYYQSTVPQQNQTLHIKDFPDIS